MASGQQRYNLSEAHKDGHVPEPKLPYLNHTPETQAIAARLQKQAEEIEVKLPADVALYVARKFGSNERELRRVFMRLFARSAMSGTEITLAYTRRVLHEFTEGSRKVPLDSVPDWRAPQLGMRESRAKFQDASAADCQAVFSVLKIQNGIKASGVRHQLEVNMRESERDGLGRRDAFERDVEIRVKKRRAG